MHGFELKSLDRAAGIRLPARPAEPPVTLQPLPALPRSTGWRLLLYRDAGTTPFRGQKGTAFEGGGRLPGLMWWPPGGFEIRRDDVAHRLL